MSGKFRFANQYALFTYKYHIDKLLVEEFFKNICNSARVRSAHETGDEQCNYNHTHVVVDFGKAYQTRVARKFDIPWVDGSLNIEVDIHPHIRTLRSRSAHTDALRYIAKEDPENADLLNVQEVTLAERVWDNASVQEALKGCNNMNQVMGTIALFNLKKLPVPKMQMEYPHQWQKNLCEALENEDPDKREVYWFYDSTGNTGKSEFCRKFFLDHPKDTVILTQFGGQKDTATIFQQLLKNGKTPRYVLCDLPRSMEDKQIYEPIEAVKNGMLTAIKYEGGFTIFDQPHVVIFANFLPRVTALSMDRWSIHELKYGLNMNDLFPEKMDPTEIRANQELADIAKAAEKRPNGSHWNEDSHQWERN